MSEFLQNLLKKVKNNADALESPPPEHDLETGATLDVRSKQKKKPKPSLHKKPGSRDSGESEPGFPHKPGLLTEPGLGTTPDSPPESGFPLEPGSRDSGESEPGFPHKPGLLTEPPAFQLLRTLAKSREDLNTLIPHMKDSELRLYQYLAELAYGNPGTPTDHMITYSQKEAMRATSIKSTATVVKAMNSLCKKKLVKWVRKSRKRGEISQIKVFLPGNFQELRMRSDDSMVE